jgi:hypothetical protein
MSVDRQEAGRRQAGRQAGRPGKGRQAGDSTDAQKKPQLVTRLISRVHGN